MKFKGKRKTFFKINITKQLSFNFENKKSPIFNFQIYVLFPFGNLLPRKCIYAADVKRGGKDYLGLVWSFDFVTIAIHRIQGL